MSVDTPSAKGKKGEIEREKKRKWERETEKEGSREKPLSR